MALLGSRALRAGSLDEALLEPQETDDWATLRRTRSSRWSGSVAAPAGDTCAGRHRVPEAGATCGIDRAEPRPGSSGQPGPRRPRSREGVTTHPHGARSGIAWAPSFPRDGARASQCSLWPGASSPSPQGPGRDSGCSEDLSLLSGAPGSLLPSATVVPPVPRPGPTKHEPHSPRAAPVTRSGWVV